MPDWLPIVAWTWFAGLTMPLGAAIASVERIRPKWLEQEFRHSVIAFGGGALLAAVALVLVPEGAQAVSPPIVALTFTAGGLACMGLDMWLAAKQTSAGQLAAMLADFIPEALALGAQMAAGNPSGPLLAFLIALQNLPEGFNAFRELKGHGSLTGRRVIFAFTLMSCLGPVAGLIGYIWLAEFPSITAGIMLFAAGGILYLLFEDIAPQVPLRRHWGPPLGAVAGFLVGLIGRMLISG